MLRPQDRSFVPVTALAACVAFALATAPLGAPAFAQDGGSPAAPPDTMLTPVSPPPDSTSPPATTAPPTASPAPAPLAAASADTSFTFPLLFDLRARDEIQRDLDGVGRLKAVAQSRLTASRALQTRRRYDADIKGTEIDAAKKRLELAKKEKRTADAKSLDEARKALDAQKDFLGKVRDRAGADADFQQATIDYANARGTMCQAELAVLALGDLSDAGTRGSATARAAQMKLNETQKARASAGSTLADREKTLCDRRKATYDAWLKLGR